MKKRYGFLLCALLFCITGCASDSEAAKHSLTNTTQTLIIKKEEPSYATSIEETKLTEEGFPNIKRTDFEVEAKTNTGTKTINSETGPSPEKDSSAPPPVDVHVHFYEKTFVEPTCTKKGYTLNKCDCGESYKSSYKDKTDHTYGDWTVTIKPSYFGEGKESRSCTLCGKEESVVLPIIPHYTCEERGIDVYEVQRLALEYIATLEDAIADPALIGTDRGGTAGWTLRVSTYPFETQEELLERVKAAVFSEYENRLRYHSKVRLHVWIDEHPSYEGDYFLHILYN